MQEDTFTFTARSAENPDKLATFTLHNGSVSVQLGEAMLEQLEEALSTRDEETVEQIKAWARPAATGSFQSVIEPIPVNDFHATLDEEALRTTAWVRAGGLRVAPVTLTWPQVDNPDGARAFVSEVHTRQQQAQETATLPGPFDYWLTWVAVAFVLVVLPVIFIRTRRQTDA